MSKRHPPGQPRRIEDCPSPHPKFGCICPDDDDDDGPNAIEAHHELLIAAERGLYLARVNLAAVTAALSTARQLDDVLKRPVTATKLRKLWAEARELAEVMLEALPPMPTDD